MPMKPHTELGGRKIIHFEVRQRGSFAADTCGPTLASPVTLMDP
jgi:hypothetical protein